MKRIVKAALLTCAIVALPSVSFAQAAPGQGAGAGAGAGAGTAAGQCQMLDPEYQVYNNANTQTQPAAKAAALEAYLTQFPNSCAKLTVLQSLPPLYLQAGDTAKAISAADRVLQLDPNNLTALLQEASLHWTAASKVTDPDPNKVAAARQPELDQAASYAQKALAAPKPANVSDADFTTFKENYYLPLYNYIAFDAFNKGDFAGAIDGYKKEIAFAQSDPKLAPQLQTAAAAGDTFNLGYSYYKTQPPDYLSCAFYTTRANSLAADPSRASVSKYCYHQYHGQTDDQYDKLTQLAQASVNPPADLATTITPAPKPAEVIAGILKTTTPDQLATADKEYILQNGTPDQVQTIWESMKGKTLEFPDVLVIASTPQQVQVAATDGAKTDKTADFTFNLAAPEDLPEHATVAQKAAYKKKQDAIATAITPGQTVTLSGTFDSYTPKPFMITMSDGQVILPEAKKPSPAHPAAHHTAPHRAQ